ncbi:hypothetical protein ACQKP1_25770 [Allorhizobium sp. NPDC080224]|jgi:hypothetical protein|uniref:Uncharacterized protein n=2 Tax=Agrobacterium TaxID=357 RepID=A0A9X3QWQ6_9HYPH|nr:MULTISPECIES: hypothetical protein [Rhizobium/Agrobacterium group]MBO9198617.1 hypothetical protein [Rhizobium sp. 16-449-1b]MCZ7472734.1 hypothetical protein [Rhizobium rhizogenes]MCZ7890007.1 hypothetical protein [Agrobacterium salinitolerans]MCZ7912938.1 hypothetical protein [Agrobacterium leguminum]WHO12063.1 hypothetical protein KZ699_26340 [Agrobacterium cucumeris]
MSKRATPIENYIAEGEVLTPKQRYEKRRREGGFVRRAYYVHKDDEAALAAFAKELEDKRKSDSD